MTRDIGARIREARLRAGVSQASLARRAGTSQAAVSRIERGLEQPTPERVEALLTSLGLRLRVELEPIAEPDADRRLLLEEGERSAAIRLEDGMRFNRFADELTRAGAAAIEAKVRAERERERSAA